MAVQKGRIIAKNIHYVIPYIDPESPIYINVWRFHFASATCSTNERIKCGMTPFLDSF